MTPGQLLRSARLRRGLTQTALAALAGTSQPVISAYERDRRDPTTATLRRLVAATGDQLELRIRARASELPPAVTAAEHGARLVDVLLLTDAVPARRARRPLAYPRIDST